MKHYLLFFIILFSQCPIKAQVLNLPPRPSDALNGSEFAQLIRNYSLTDRENDIYEQIMNGNIPDFQRNLVPITFNQNINGENYQVTYYVLPDYVAIGSNDDYFLIPMTPVLAQRICNNLNCTLPTRKMVDQIWSNATVKLSPAPIPPSDTMTTVPVFWQHNQIVWQQRQAVIQSHPLGELVAGDKKDVVISNLIYGNPPPNRVVIYGWHYQNGVPIQPLYNGHSETYADYSHGIRLVQDSIILNNQPTSLKSVLQNDSLYSLFSDEGRIPQPFYPLSSSSLSPPDAWGVISNGDNSLKLIIHNNPEVAHYLAYISTDGINYPTNFIIEKQNPVITGLQNDSIYYIKIRSVGIDTSNFSEVLTGITGNFEKQVLIINGFDRAYTGNTRDFVRMYAPAISNSGFKFESATNEAIVYNLINLSDFDFVVWILGTESTVDETFSSSEQNYVSSYLKNGGALFVSGSEIAWDLDYKGSASDKNFFCNFLKAEYISDAPNNQSNTFYSAEGINGSIFSSITNINFDNGTHGTYNVSWPDVVNGKNGGLNVLKYSNLPSDNFAATAFKGIFPGGTYNGGVVYLGFPFETIYPENKRFEIMDIALEFLSNLNDVSGNIFLPDEYKLYQNYPNPFNSITIIRWQQPEPKFTNLTIYDVLGKEIKTLVNEYLSQGTHEVSFNADDLSSGIYYYQLKTDDFFSVSKMILIK